MRQPFVLFKGLTFQKLCLPGAFRPGDHHNPPGAPAAAELLLHSVIAGATMQWAVDPDGELADHVLAQIAAILCLMFPEHDDFQLLQAHA